MYPLTYYSFATAQTLSIFKQLLRFERLPLGIQHQEQRKQISRLLMHAWQHSHFWRDRLSGSGFNPNNHHNFEISEIPILTRANLQSNFEQLRARSPELINTEIATVSTSGSTGEPVRVEKSIFFQGPLENALALIDLRWHKRDPAKSIAFIGFGAKDKSLTSWGGIYHELGWNGPYKIRAIENRNTQEHLDWLIKTQPDYLKASPFLVEELAKLAMDNAMRLKINQVISMSERVSPVQRRLAFEVFGAKIIDRYSCEETGMMALQCPLHDHLHVLSAGSHLEIVNEFGRQCRIGEIGTVLVTNLYSYAMPIIRYDLGDLAEWGSPCDCGITLPVIKRLWGRKRHKAVGAGGYTFPMGFLGDELGKITNIKSFRIKQYLDNVLELEVVLAKTLSHEEKKVISDIFTRNGFSGVDLFMCVVDQIVWPSNRKREEFERIYSAYKPGNQGIVMRLE